MSLMLFSHCFTVVFHPRLFTVEINFSSSFFLYSTLFYCHLLCRGNCSCFLFAIVLLRMMKIKANSVADVQQQQPSEASFFWRFMRNKTVIKISQLFCLALFPVFTEEFTRFRCFSARKMTRKRWKRLSNFLVARATRYQQQSKQRRFCFDFLLRPST